MDSPSSWPLIIAWGAVIVWLNALESQVTLRELLCIAENFTIETRTWHTNQSWVVGTNNPLDVLYEPLRNVHSPSFSSILCDPMGWTLQTASPELLYSLVSRWVQAMGGVTRKAEAREGALLPQPLPASVLMFQSRSIHLWPQLPMESILHGPHPHKIPVMLFTSSSLVW